MNSGNMTNASGTPFYHQLPFPSAHNGQLVRASGEPVELHPLMLVPPEAIETVSSVVAKKIWGGMERLASYFLGQSAYGNSAEPSSNLQIQDNANSTTLPKFGDQSQETESLSQLRMSSINTDILLRPIPNEKLLQLETDKDYVFNSLSLANLATQSKAQVAKTLTKNNWKPLRWYGPNASAWDRKQPAGLNGFVAKDKKTGDIYFIFRESDVADVDDERWKLAKGQLGQDGISVLGSPDTGGQTSTYFQEYWQHENEKIMADFEKFSKEGQNIIVSGHSLGGSMSNFFMHELLYCDPMTAFDEPLQARLIHITFGSPKVGDEVFVAPFREKYSTFTQYQFVMEDDVRPKQSSSETRIKHQIFGGGPLNKVTKPINPEKSQIVMKRQYEGLSKYIPSKSIADFFDGEDQHSKSVYFNAISKLFATTKETNKKEL